MPSRCPISVRARGLKRSAPRCSSPAPALAALVVSPAECGHTTRRAALTNRPPARVIAFPISYPVSGCVPQSGPWEPPVWVTCVNPVPSTLTT